MLELQLIKKSDPQLNHWMENHYSQPKGFVGRSLIYKIVYDGKPYGAISAGSATKFLPGRKDFFNQYYENISLNNIVNNTFYHIEPIPVYPRRNFTTYVVQEWRKRIILEWEEKYKDPVLGFETLVELPRTGSLYLKDKWIEVGLTKGYTCKREAGIGTDSWTGKRVWNTKELRPKRVFVRLINP